MEWQATGSTALASALIAVAAIAAWTDIRERRIPNWLCGINLLLGFGYTWIVSEGSALGSTGLHVVVALVVAIALNLFGAIGAGDAKFYASMAAWLPFNHAVWLLVSVSLAGLVLLFVMIAARRVGPRQRADVKHENFAKLPYGVAIGLGGLLAVWLS